MENNLNLEKSKIEEGLLYAQNILHGSINHLHLDKDFIHQHLHLNGKKILDFGCGMGGMTLWYAQNFDCEVTGIDIDEHHIAISQLLLEKHPTSNVTFELRNILTNPLTEKYDVIILNDVAEHIPLAILEEILAQLKNCLTEKGVLFVSYPPWESPYASHLNHVIKMPWSQFVPKFILDKWLTKKNIQLVGTKDLKQEFYELNHLNHRKLRQITRKLGLQVSTRYSHCKLNSIPFLKHYNFSISILKYLITKELIVFSKA